MRRKLQRINALMQTGFSIDTIESDDTLDVTLVRGPTRIKIRFDRTDVEELWPLLFDSDDDIVDVAPAIQGAGTLTHVGPLSTPRPKPYGYEDVREFLRRDQVDVPVEL